MLDGQIPEEEKGRRLSILQERQRAIQIRRNAEWVGRVEEVMVEGFNNATSQWIGRTHQNKTLNFIAPPETRVETGQYLEARVTRSGPNSLAGEAVL
jgi:tRNA-2-methylthio-N6-dimethylallyladenosine synthase